MVTLKINGKEITVEEGTLILDAAKEAGIHIPTFCYQANLSSLGSCRMCLVEIEGQKKLQPSCITPVMGDISVLTENETVTSARSAMLEFLLSNHSFDCPVCDKGGECELQDMVHEYGPHKGRHAEPKVRFHQKDYTLNAVIVKNSNRCVQCQRCVRVCTEVVGLGVLGAIGRGAYQEETSFLKSYLDCDHDGMCIEVCPVGSFMRRPFRYKARPWDLTSAKTVCPYCATGCRMTVQERDSEVVRSIAFDGQGFNGRMLCARGRFGYDYVSSPERLTTPLLKNPHGAFEPVSWTKAMDVLKERLTRPSPEKVGGVASARLTNEELYTFGKLMRGYVGTPNIDSTSRWAPEASLDYLLSTGITEGGTSLHKCTASDSVLVLGTQLSEENPVTDYIVRYVTAAGRKAVLVASPRAMKLDASALLSIRYAPGELGAFLATIVACIYKNNSAKLGSVKEAASLDVDGLSRLSRAPLSEVEALSLRLLASESVALLAGTDMLRHHDGATELSLLKRTLKALGKDVRMMPILDRSNQRGAWDMGVHPFFGPGYSVVKESIKESAKEAGLGTEGMLEAAIEGEFEALYVAGEDIAGMFPDRTFATFALKKLKFLAVQANFMTETAKLADLVLPSASFAEKRGTMTNQEGRVQSLSPLLQPPGEAKTDLEIFSWLGSALDTSFGPRTPEEVLTEIRSSCPAYREVEPECAPPKVTGADGNGTFNPQLTAPSAQRPETVEVGGKGKGSGKAPKTTGKTGKAAADANTTKGAFSLVTGNHLFGSGHVSGRSAILKGIINGPVAELSLEDARELGVGNGDFVLISAEGYEARFAVRTRKGSLKGVVFIPENFEDAPVNAYFDRAKGIPGVRVIRSEA